MNYDDFFNIVDIADKDRDAAVWFMDMRGIQEHIEVAKFLQAFKSDKVTYDEVSTAFRYDKRIRRILYKYLGVIEEISKSFIANNFENLDDLPKSAYKKITKLEHNKSHNSNNTRIALSYCLFPTAFKIIEKLDDVCKDKLPNVMNYSIKNREALCTLRNQVGHNKFLINNMDLKEVEIIKGYKSTSLKDNIYNLMSFLPLEMKDKFKKEINDASIEKDKTFDKQSKWLLIENIVIHID